MATKPSTQSATQPTFSLEVLRHIIDTPEAKQLFLELMKDTTKEVAKADATEAADKACIRAFTKKGYKPEAIKPRVTTLTFNKWLEQGRRVKEGEKSVTVGRFRLFHLDQTREMTKAERAEALAALAAKREGKGTASKLPPVSPIPSAAPKAAKGRKSAPQQPAA